MLILLARAEQAGDLSVHGEAGAETLDADALNSNSMAHTEARAAATVTRLPLLLKQGSP